ncbi:MAG: chromosome partitioning protein ParB, partial [Lachnospiraceae bacterium]|nr:chromosome partitioning protein ParB [Lachnospiraceae bacterium]
PVIVRNYTDDEATIIMVDANIQREDISYSEKAKAYKMKFEAMKHQGSRGSNTYKEVGEAAGDNIKMVQRYIRLAELIPSLLDMVDEKKLGFICGVDISYLTEEEQTWVFNILSRKKINISIVQSSKLKDYSKNGKLTEEMVRLILMDHKPKERKVVIKSDEISRFFPAEYSNEDIEKVIYQLLEQWKKEGQL